jgi:hypothetical protein
MQPLKFSGSLHAPPAPFSFKDKPVHLAATVSLCISCQLSVLLIDNCNTTDGGIFTCNRVAGLRIIQSGTFMHNTG